MLPTESFDQGKGYDSIMKAQILANENRQNRLSPSRCYDTNGNITDRGNNLWDIEAESSVMDDADRRKLNVLEDKKRDVEKKNKEIIEQIDRVNESNTDLEMDSVSETISKTDDFEQPHTLLHYVNNDGVPMQDLIDSFVYDKNLSFVSISNICVPFQKSNDIKAKSKFCKLHKKQKHTDTKPKRAHCRDQKYPRRRYSESNMHDTETKRSWHNNEPQRLQSLFISNIVSSYENQHEYSQKFSTFDLNLYETLNCPTFTNNMYETWYDKEYIAVTRRYFNPKKYKNVKQNELAAFNDSSICLKCKKFEYLSVVYYYTISSRMIVTKLKRLNDFKTFYYAHFYQTSPNEEHVISAFNTLKKFHNDYDFLLIGSFQNPNIEFMAESYFGTTDFLISKFLQFRLPTNSISNKLTNQFGDCLVVSKSLYSRIDLWIELIPPNYRSNDSNKSTTFLWYADLWQSHNTSGVHISSKCSLKTLISRSFTTKKSEKLNRKIENLNSLFDLKYGNNNFNENTMLLDISGYSEFINYDLYNFVKRNSQRRSIRAISVPPFCNIDNDKIFDDKRNSDNNKVIDRNKLFNFTEPSFKYTKLFMKSDNSDSSSIENSPIHVTSQDNSKIESTEETTCNLLSMNNGGNLYPNLTPYKMQSIDNSKYQSYDNLNVEIFASTQLPPPPSYSSLSLNKDEEQSINDNGTQLLKDITNINNNDDSNDERNNKIYREPSAPNYELLFDR